MTHIQLTKRSTTEKHYLRDYVGFIIEHHDGLQTLYAIAADDKHVINLSSGFFGITDKYDTIEELIEDYYDKDTKIVRLYKSADEFTLEFIEN